MKKLIPTLSVSSKCKKTLEARAGIEPAHKGFADLSLTTWVPRLDTSTVARYSLEIQPSRFPRWIEIIADTGSDRASCRHPGRLANSPNQPVLSESTTRMPWPKSSCWRKNVGSETGRRAARDCGGEKESCGNRAAHEHRRSRRGWQP